MTILNSLLFGSGGEYTVLGTPVEFKEASNIFNNSNLSFAYIVEWFVTDPFISVITLTRLHVLIHEMGHAIAGWFLEGVRSKITIYTNIFGGMTQPVPEIFEKRPLFFYLSGPLVGIVFESAKLVAAAASAIFLPLPIGIPLAALVGFGSVVWISIELYNIINNWGDWTQIYEAGALQYYFSALLMLSAVALSAAAIAGMILLV